MTQAIRVAAQTLIDALDAKINDVVPYEQVADLRAALSAPQPTASDAVEVLKIVRQYPDFDNGGPLPDAIDSVLRGERPAILDAVDALAHGFTPAPRPTADERVSEFMRLMDASLCPSIKRGGHTYRLIEQSARALLSASQEDAEHAAMYRWIRANGEPDESLGYRVDWSNELYDAAIRSAMKEKKA